MYSVFPYLQACCLFVKTFPVSENASHPDSHNLKPKDFLSAIVNIDSVRYVPDN